MAFVHIKANEFLRSKDLLEKALRLNPKDPRVKMHLGVVYIKMKEFEKAVIILRDLVADKSRLPEPRYHLARAYLGQKQTELARRELAIGYHLDPEDQRISKLLNECETVLGLRGK
ncbi:MAG: tetratricopeptide repeat protein [Candidatus Margulisbacteria bacterium]|nr:tetratricopeptide repeat protein [Candidatus Margulisiibacteriota bacterium]